MGFEFIDENMLAVINNLNKFFMRYFSSFVQAGRMLGAVLALFVIAIEAYQVMLQKKEFDFLAIARPIAIALVLSVWQPLVVGVGAIPRSMERFSYSVFYKEQAKIISLRETRTEAAEKLKDKTNEAKAASDIAVKQVSNGNMWDKIVAMGEDFLKNIKEQVATFGTLWQAQINRVLEEWVIKIGQLFWQIMIYLLFFLKEVFASILIITGPITFGLSVIPAFKDAWSQWFARYISVLLYGFIGYLVLAAAMQLIKYGITIDIQVLTTANSSSAAFAAYSKSSVVTALLHFVGLMVGGLALRMVPELSTWIIPSSTVHAANSFTSGVYSKITNTAKGAVNLATGGR